MLKVKVGQDKDSLPQKLQKVSVILDKMEGNSNFPQAQTMIAPLRAVVAALNDAMLAANASQLTTKGLFTVQGQVEAQLDNATANLCADVNTEAKGDQVKLESSGFPLAKEAEAAKVPGLITDFSLTRSDHAGAFHGHCHGVTYARSYESRFIVALMPEGEWTAGPSFFNSQFEWTGFQSGATVWVEVRAKGTAGEGPWSDPISIVVP